MTECKVCSDATRTCSRGSGGRRTVSSSRGRAFSSKVFGCKTFAGHSCKSFAEEELDELIPSCLKGKIFASCDSAKGQGSRWLSVQVS